MYCADAFRIIIMINRTMPVANRACRCIPEAYPISMPMFVVSVLTGSRIDVGIATALPKTIMTAIVSPTARPVPKMTAATIPDLADGKITDRIVCQWVMPSASAPSLYWRGKARIDTSEILMTVGKTMIARIIEPAIMLSPGPPR